MPKLIALVLLTTPGNSDAVIFTPIPAAIWAAPAASGYALVASCDIDRLAIPVVIPADCALPYSPVISLSCRATGASDFEPTCSYAI